jgi:HD-GYP domain-containing protein (c-di-GMP phosphodiesterase class II)
MISMMELTEQVEHPFQMKPGFDIRPFLPHALAATLAVFGLPAAVVLGIIVMPGKDPSFVITSGLSIVLSTIASVIGTSVWMRHPASSNVSFGDLMLWGWARRRRAETKLDRGTRLLGLDRRGQPVQRIRITRDRQLKVLHDLNDALEAKDPYTRGHSERVERHVYRTAAAMGLSVHDLQELRMAAALHDIGKIRVPDRIIRKPGKLTAEERALMEEHSVVGAWMLSHVASADVIEAVRHHHERWDGKGYPDGLAGTDIPLYSRIIAVCDTFDAITSTRPYRAKAERQRAIDVLKEECGTQFDPMAVDVFLKALPTKVPVTAMLLMLPGAGKVIREFARVLKRAGASSLASATTAASASVIIGAATVAPMVDRLPVRLPEPVAAPAAVQGAAGAAGVSAGVPLGPVTPAHLIRTIKTNDRVAELAGDLTRGTTAEDSTDQGEDPTAATTIIAAPDPTSGDEVAEDVTGGSGDGDTSGEDPGRSGDHETGRPDDAGQGKPENPGGGHGKPEDPGNGGGKPEDPGNGGGKPEEPGNGNSDDAPGNSDGGHGNGNDDTPGNSGGGNGNGGGNSDNPPGSDDTPPGNSGGGNGNGGGNSDDTPGNSGGGNGNGNGNGGGNRDASGDPEEEEEAPGNGNGRGH